MGFGWVQELVLSYFQGQFLYLSTTQFFTQLKGKIRGLNWILYALNSYLNADSQYLIFDRV